MALNSFKAIGHAMEKMGVIVTSTVTGAGATLLQTASGATQAGGNFVSRTFHLAVKEAEEEFNAVKYQIQRVSDSEEEAILTLLAGKKVQEYADIVQSLVVAWPRVLLSLGTEVEVLRHVASQKSMEPQAATAMKRIATAPEFSEVLSKAAEKSIVSFAVEFGDSVAAVASVDGALGFVTELRNIANVKRYGSVYNPKATSPVAPAMWLWDCIPPPPRIAQDRLLPSPWKVPSASAAVLWSALASLI